MENRRASPYSPRAPNLLHVLPSRMVGWNDLCTPGPLYAPCKAGGTRPQIGQHAGVSLFNPRIALSYLGNFLLYSRIQQASAFSVGSFGLVGCEEDGATLAGRPRAACLANIHPRWEALLPHICTRLHICLLGAQCPNAHICTRLRILG